jgi:hypothetical protein
MSTVPFSLELEMSKDWRLYEGVRRNVSSPDWMGESGELAYRLPGLMVLKHYVSGQTLRTAAEGALDPSIERGVASTRVGRISVYEGGERISFSSSGVAVMSPVDVPVFPYELVQERAGSTESSFGQPTASSTIKVSEPSREALDAFGAMELVGEFALGLDGETPVPWVVSMVERIARAVESRTKGYVYSVDEDGAYSFDAWLPNGRFIMCEVDLYGEINTGLYHSPSGPQEMFLPRMTESELLGIF